MNKNQLRKIIREILFENSGLEQESFKFNWKTGEYKWVDDKKGTNIDTSMVKKDEKGSIKYGYKEQLLPKSDLISYNLFDIKNFNVTQALKHGKAKNMELVPDDSIQKFKEYTAKYIARLLNNKGYSIDIILTPQSSAKLSGEISDLVSKVYKEMYGKNVQVIKNAFIKAPEDVTLDIKSAEKHLGDEAKHHAPELSDELLNKKVKNRIEDIKHDIEIWKKESDMLPTIQKIYKLQQDIEDIEKSRGWRKKKDEKIQIIVLEIDKLLDYIKKTFGPDYIKTRFFKYGRLKPEEDVKSWQIKNLSDAVRKSINNLFKFSQDLDTEYSYADKQGETITGKSSFIDNLKRNNKTIMIFDDNISSGATLDDIGQYLINNGIKKENIAIVTLGTVPLSLYNRNLVRHYR